MLKQILTILLVFTTCLSWSQNTVIQGIISDFDTGEPLPGATIFEKATGEGTVSDLEGKFNLKLEKLPAALSFAYIGYKAVSVEVSNDDFLRIGLFTNNELLGEIVVTALGFERSSKSLGYAVQQINGSEINEVKSVNFLDNLSGKLAGVTVSRGATGIGSTSKITIRGEGSFANNNPLFVVDGIPINNRTILNATNSTAAGFQEVDFGNGAMEVNPDDIASVSVLKGPSAAALYGTRASNGVIIINTKDGSERKGLGVSFNSTTFVESVFQLPEFQNKYGQGNSGEFEFVDGLGGGTNDNITYSYGPELDVGNLVSQFDSPVVLPDGQVVRGGDVAVHGGAPIQPTPFVSNPDNLKNFYETGTTTINNLAFSGGYGKGDYRLSFTDVNSNSVIPGVNLERKTAAARLSFKPVEKLKVSTAINYVNSKSDNRPANGYGSENINYSLVAWLGRQSNLNSLKDYWQPGLEDVQQYSFNYTFFDNPYLILKENRNSFNRDRIFGNVVASYEMTEHLSLTFRSGMDYSDETRQFRRAFSTNRFKNGGYAEHDVFYREINTDLLLNYAKNFGDISFDLSVGGNKMNQNASTSQIQALSLAQPGIFKLSNAASPLEIFEQTSEKEINSVYGLLKLGYKDFLFVDVTGRNDWSSALATPTSTDNTSLFYPSVSASFVASNIFELPEVVSFVKVRASWAQVGNDTDPYQTAGVFQPQTPYNGQPTFGDQTFIPNSNLLPEQTTSYEIGADVRFFNDRLNFDLTYYDALVENQILSLPIALSSGYTQQIRNGGAVRSKGVEIMMGISPIRTKDFNWNTSLNFSRNVSTVESLPDETEVLTLGFSGVYDNVNQRVWYQVSEGDRIGDMWGTGYQKNEAGEFVVTVDGKFIVDNTLIKLGNYNSDFILGLTNQFKYKNFGLGFTFDWRQGGTIVSRTQALAGVGGQLAETGDRPEAGIIIDGVVNTGTDENPVYAPNTTPIPAETFYRSFYDRNHEENNTYDASYLKLREFSVSYTLNKKALSNTIFNNLENVRIALVGKNLFAVSSIPHFDPEQLAVQGQNFVSGVEDMSYPTTRSFGLSLGVDF
ncbi:MAG: TonB-linked SusC/RagA family outer membrane protein [Saprospiraceae bacterium]